MTSCASKCPADLIRWQKSVGAHQNPAHTSPTHLSTHSYPTLISKKHHMLTSREKCGLARNTGPSLPHRRQTLPVASVCPALSASQRHLASGIRRLDQRQQNWICPAKSSRTSMGSVSYTHLTLP